MQGTRINSIRRIAYADLNMSLAYCGIVFRQSILDVLLRVLSF